jgi:hypothetical protein
MKKSTGGLTKVAASDELGAARDAVVAAIDAMGAAYLEMADAWEAGAEPDRMERAQGKMQDAGKQLEAAFQGIQAICTGE